MAVLVPKVLAQQPEVLRRSLADVALKTASFVHNVLAHVSFECVFVAKDFPALETRRLLLLIATVEISHMAFVNRLRFEFFVANFASMNSRFVVIFEMLEENAALSELFVAADQLWTVAWMS